MRKSGSLVTPNKSYSSLFVVLAITVALLSVQGGRAEPKTAAPRENRNQTCVNGKDTVRKAWILEQELTDLGMSTSPATNARAAYKKAEGIEHELMMCEIAANNAHEQEEKDMYSAERINLQFISGSQVAYGGLAAVPNSRFPTDLGDLAPACKDVLASDLAERIEKFAKTNRDTSALKPKDVAPHYDEADPREGAGLTICADQAGRIGYKDAALRLLLDRLMLENLMHIATLNEQASIVKALGAVQSNTPMTVQVGPRHCTATLHDWGWQKTVSWDCF